jgi:hypothetical protein
MSESQLVAPAPEHCPGTDSEAAGKASGTQNYTIKQFQFWIGLNFNG